MPAPREQLGGRIFAYRKGLKAGAKRTAHD
jgi:hypothetical protein